MMDYLIKHSGGGFQARSKATRPGSCSGLTRSFSRSLKNVEQTIEMNEEKKINVYTKYKKLRFMWSVTECY